MMQFKEKITRENAMDIIRRFAKEYRKTLGKAPAEIIIVGGGSIMVHFLPMHLLSIPVPDLLKARYAVFRWRQ